MTFTQSIQSCLHKYVTFSGRARRSEYWWFALLSVALNIAARIVGTAVDSFVPVILVALAMFLPGLAVGVRRLHDTNRSGWWLLLSLVPLAGIVVLVFVCQDSTPDNAYGPSPKPLAQSGVYV